MLECQAAEDTAAELQTCCPACISAGTRPDATGRETAGDGGVQEQAYQPVVATTVIEVGCPCPTPA